MPSFFEIPSFSKDIQWTSLDALVGQPCSKVSEWLSEINDGDHCYYTPTTLEYQRVHILKLIGKYGNSRLMSKGEKKGRYLCVTDIYVCTAKV